MSSACLHSGAAYNIIKLIYFAIKNRWMAMHSGKSIIDFVFTESVCQVFSKL